jgi:methyl-accepting chemotaxis protein
MTLFGLWQARPEESSGPGEEAETAQDAALSAQSEQAEAAAPTTPAPAGPDAEALRAAMAAIGARRYDSVPQGDDPIGRDLKALAETLRRAAANDLDHAVERNAAVIEEVIAVTELYRGSTDVSRRTESIAAAVEELAATSASISDNCRIAAEDAEKAQKAATDQAASAAGARAQMAAICEAVVTANERLERLTEATARISKSIEEIGSIARQTNLLALNASIEAARAGDAGKGFAVVAGEVRALAEKAGQATSEIRQRVGDLTAGASEIAGAMAKANDLAGQGDTAMAQLEDSAKGVADIAARTRSVSVEITDTVQTQSVAADEISQNIQHIAADVSANLDAVQKLLDKIDADQEGSLAQLTALGEADIPNKALKLAKTDHLLWRKKLSAMAVGRETGLDLAKLADHQGCRFGKWKAEQVGKPIARHPAFSAIDAPHRRMHDLGVEAARLYERGDLDGALEKIDAVAEASIDVLRGLDELAAANA